MDDLELSSGMSKCKHIRLLIKESHSIFSTLQKDKTNILESSRKYRCVLHECIENLSSDPIRKDIERQSMFHELEILWTLCEILMIDVRKTGILISQLKNWIKMYSETLNENIKRIYDLLDNGNYQLNPNDDKEEYWNIVTKHVLMGDTRRAIQLLQCHHKFETNNQIRIVATMLERMPSSAQFIVHEFYNKWHSWLEFCKTELETGQFDDFPELLNIVKVLCQETEVYDKLSHHFDNWYQLMVTYLIYNDPCIKDTKLTDLCRLSMTIFAKSSNNKTQSDEPSKFDEIMIAAFEYDLMKVVALCCSYFNDDYWFVTHFVDLLHHSEQLKIQEVIESEKMRECFIFDYAKILFNDETLWAIGASYLNFSGSNSTNYLNVLLPRVYLDYRDDKKANKLISIAKKQNLSTLTNFFSLTMAKKWIAICPKFDESILSPDNRLGKEIFKSENLSDLRESLSNALYWAIKSEDIPFITYISELYLLYYCKTKSFPFSLSTNLGRSMLITERLAFASKYYEFKQILDSDGDKLEAANLFINLLTSKIYPGFFVKELLSDANQLLKIEPELIFNTEKTFVIMKYFEEIGYKLDESSEQTISCDRELQRNLVRNLAKAVISPF